MIKVKTRSLDYPVVVGFQILDQLPGLLNDRPKGSRLFVVYDAQVFALHGAVIRRYLSRSGLRLLEISLPSGERTKSPGQLGKLHDWLLSEKVTRSDMIIAVGGGVVSDLAGFAAATILRGVRWGVVSTSLLGQVDAAIGGKTGINHARGKNLIGAFWQPSFVLCDVCFLNTLPHRQMINGLGEVTKYSGLIGQEMMRRLDRFIEAGDLYDMALLEPIVARSARYKARVVAADEREAGQRMVLNLGHTFGHAVEASLGYRRLYHGEAVVLGLIAAADLSERHLSLGRETMAPLKSLCRQLLRHIPSIDLDPSRIIDYMKLDKKRSASALNMVLLEEPGKPIIVHRVTPGKVRASVAAMVRFFTDQGGKDA